VKPPYCYQWTADSFHGWTAPQRWSFHGDLRFICFIFFSSALVNLVWCYSEFVDRAFHGYPVFRPLLVPLQWYLKGPMGVYFEWVHDSLPVLMFKCCENIHRVLVWKVNERINEKNEDGRKHFLRVFTGNRILDHKWVENFKDAWQKDGTKNFNPYNQNRPTA
jgi:hypothetical protein